MFPPKEQLLTRRLLNLCKDVLLKPFTSQSFMLKLAGFPGVESDMILLIGDLKPLFPGIVAGVRSLAWGPQAPPNKWPLQTLAAWPLGLPGLGQSRSDFLGWKERPGAPSGGFFHPIASHGLNWTHRKRSFGIPWEFGVVFFPKKNSRFPVWKTMKTQFFSYKWKLDPWKFSFSFDFKKAKPKIFHLDDPLVSQYFATSKTTTSEAEGLFPKKYFREI